jgi:hypothetical protein
MLVAKHLGMKNALLSTLTVHVQQIGGVWYKIKKVYFCIVLIKTA